MLQFQKNLIWCFFFFFGRIRSSVSRKTATEKPFSHHMINMSQMLPLSIINKKKTGSRCRILERRVFLMSVSKINSMGFNYVSYLEEAIVKIVLF